MPALNRTNYPLSKRPEKIILFGSGNFLRGFICWQIQQLNQQTHFNAGVVCTEREVVTKPVTLNDQDGLFYTLTTEVDSQGVAHVRPLLIDCITREISLKSEFSLLLECANNLDIKWIFSNTTEAGIQYDPQDQFSDHPPRSFPAKMVRLLYARYLAATGDMAAGFTIIPCELIEHNGETLKAIMLQIAQDWQLPEAFCYWLKQANLFCDTLVDRIVPGKPRDSAITDILPFQDEYCVMAEAFYLFVIQAPVDKHRMLQQQLCLDQLSVPLNIIMTDDLTPYKQQKVSLLNGAHTALVPVGYLMGIDTVNEAMQHPMLKAFMSTMMLEEISPMLNQPIEKSHVFSKAVLERFQNPHLKHQLLTIALNGMSKFKTRNLPTLLRYHEQTRQLPPHLCFAFAALMVFYRQTRFINDTMHQYCIQDEPEWLSLYAEQWRHYQQGHCGIEQVVHQVLSQKNFWGTDLSQLPELSHQLTLTIQSILDVGIENALMQLISATSTEEKDLYAHC